MKSLLLAALLTASSLANAYPGFLQSQSVSGMNKYCSYSNGKIITIGMASICPMQVN